MDSRNEEVRLQGLGQVLEFIGEIDDEDPRLVTVFGSMIRFVLERRPREREEALRFIISSVQMAHDPREVDAALAFILQVISGYDVEAATREAAMRIYFSELQRGRDDSDEGDSDEDSMEDMMNEIREALREGGERARDVMMHVLGEALSALEQGRDEEAEMMFHRVLRIVASFDDEEVRYSNLGLVLEFLDNIDNDELSTTVFVSLVNFVLSSTEQRHQDVMSFLIYAIAQSDDVMERDEALGLLFYLMVANEDFETRYTYLPILIGAVFGDDDASSLESSESSDSGSEESHEGGMGPLDDEAMHRLAHALSQRLSMVRLFHDYLTTFNF